MIVLIFLAWHLVNHASAAFNPEFNQAMMLTLRKWYRSEFVQPVLVTLVLFQVISGAILWWRATAGPGDLYRILQTHGMLVASGLQPHRLPTFTFSPDPDFEAKLLDVAGLYLNPPQNALVFCVDEKPGIQALDRTQPLLPLRAKKPRSWTTEYVRHGTPTLLTALEIATGRVLSEVNPRRTSVNFLPFMNRVVTHFPQRALHVVLHNLNIHHNAAARRWLTAIPGFAFTLPRRHASWVNLAECFFSILTRRRLH